MRWVPVLLVLTGCLGSIPGGDDDPEPDARPDGPVPMTSLRLAWSSLPAMIPGPVGGDLDVDDARLDLENLRIVGDAGTVSEAQLRLEWDDQVMPGAVDFDLPSGLYSLIVFELDDDAVRIDGEVEIDSNEVNFRIDQIGDLSISIPMSLELMPGDYRTQTLTIDFGRFLGVIDFESLPVVDGRRLLTAGDPQIATALAELQASFSVETTPQN